MADPARLRRDLAAIVGDGMAFSVMVGAGEKAFQQFTSALGYREVAAGLVLTLPIALAAVLQLAAPFVVARMGSERRWVLLGASLQALALLPLIAGALAGRMPLVLLFAAVTLHQFGTLGTAPAWTSWMEVLVPARIRERFFARRSALCHAAQFIAIIAAGAYLHIAEDAGQLLPAFGALFAVACGARIVSVAFLVTQSDSGALHPEARHVSPVEVLRRVVGGSSLRTLFGYLPFLASVYVAYAFFTPWARDHLKLGDDRVLWLSGAEFLGRLTALPALGVYARHRGARAVLRIGCVVLVPIALLWAVSPEFWWLAAVQVVSGAAWAAVELGGFLLFFETVDRSERVSVMSVFYLAYYAAALGGSLVGGALLDALGRDGTAFFTLFGVSTIARILALRLVRPQPRGTAPVAPPTGVVAPP